MTMRDTAPKTQLLPLILALTLACLAGAAILTLMSRSAPPVAAPNEQITLVVERIPFEAQNALRGEASAFDSMNRSMARLKTLASGAGHEVSLEPSLGKFGAAVSSVADARPAVEAIQAANQEARDLAPKLLSELGDLASAVGVQKLEGMSRYLERFELAVQRIQQELNGMASGVSDAAPTAQRLADSLEFLNQVVRGLSGEESGMALTRVTGPDAEQRLKTVVQRNQQFAASVRKAIGAAKRLTTGRALGIDSWRRTRTNIEIEGVSGTCELLSAGPGFADRPRTRPGPGDSRKMPPKICIETPNTRVTGPMVSAGAKRPII